MGTALRSALGVFVLCAIFNVACGYSRGTSGKHYDYPRQHYHTRNGSSRINPRTPPRFTKIFEWKQLDYQFPNQQIRQQAIQGKTFIEKNSAMPLSLQAHGSRLFVSVPRWRAGVPSTLNHLALGDLRSGGAAATSPPLVPYPNLNFNRQGNCDGVTSVFRMFADKCSRLWVVDTGRVGAQQLCPPQVLAFDLNTDKVIYKHRFQPEVLKCNSQPTNIAVEYKRGQHCGQPKPDAFLYVTDTGASAIIVIDTKTETSWRVSHNSMYPAPEAGTFSVAGQHFDLMDGVVGLTLGPVKNQNHERNLYYNPMSTFNHFWVPTSLLQSQNATPTANKKFEAGAVKKTTQSAGCGMDASGVLFFGLLNQNAIACWNSDKPYTPINRELLARSDLEMQFLSTVVVDPQDQVWALSTRFHRFFTRTMDPEEINFRVFTALASEAVRGTLCEP